MKYLLLIYSNTATWEGLPEEDRDRMAAEHAALVEELVASGEWVDGAPLADPVNTRTVRTREGAVAVTDGPYLETKEHLTGYDMVDCDGPERAVEIAARIPDARLAAVEVRPVVSA